MPEKIKVPKPEEEKPEKEETPFEEEPKETPFKEGTDEKEEKEEKDEKEEGKDDESEEEENLQKECTLDERGRQCASITLTDVLKEILKEEKNKEKIESTGKILWRLKRLKVENAPSYLEKLIKNVLEILQTIPELAKEGKWGQIIYQLDHPLISWLSKEKVGEGLEMLYPNKKEEVIKLIGQITTHLADPEKMFTIAIAKKLENLKRSLG